MWLTRQTIPRFSPTRSIPRRRKHPPGVNAPLRTLLLRQVGVISREQAVRAGLTNRQIDHRIHTGEWLRVHPSVYRLAVVVPSAESAARAAALWLGPAAALTGLAAGWWWGLLDEPPTTWHFISPRSHPQRRPGIRTSRTFVDPADLTRHRSILTISRPLAVLRSASQLEQLQPGRGITLIDRTKQRRLLGQDDLERAFRRNAGTWGTRAMRRVLDRTGDRAHSELERLAVGLLREAGVTGFAVNWRTTLSSGRPVELDIAFRQRRLAIELDGYAYHSSPESHRADLNRANELMADGWVVRRFTYADLIADPDGFVRTVLAVLAD